MFGKIKALEAQIEKLKGRLDKAEQDLTIPHGGLRFRRDLAGGYKSCREKIEIGIVVKQILDYLELDIVEEPKREKTVVLKKRQKNEKPKKQGDSFF